MGRLLRCQNRLSESKIALEKAIALDPNNPNSFLQFGITLVFLGEPAAALSYFEKRLQLDPHSPNHFFAYWWSGTANLLLGRTDEAVDFYRKARIANPRFPASSLFLAAAFGLRGDIDEAKAALKEALKLRPDLNSLTGILGSPNYRDMGSPQYFALREKTFAVGLRRAGMPE